MGSSRLTTVVVFRNLSTDVVCSAQSLEPVQSRPLRKASSWVQRRAAVLVTLPQPQAVVMGKKPQSLGRVELELLQYIDENHPITVREVAEYWSAKTGQARTTVLTMMERLTKKGFLSRKKVENVFHYSPKQSIAEVLRNMVSDFVHGVLGGSVAPLAAYLTEDKPLSADQLQQLKSLVQRLESDESAKGKKRS